MSCIGFDSFVLTFQSSIFFFLYKIKSNLLKNVSNIQIKNHSILQFENFNVEKVEFRSF